jgi:subtilisin family serine protease
MAKRILLIVLAGLFVFNVSFEAPTEGDDLYQGRQLILKISAPAKLSERFPGGGEMADFHLGFVKRYGEEIQDIQFHPYTGYYVVATGEGVDLEDLKGRLLREASVEKVSFNYMAYIYETIPNDPDFKYQYALLNTGQLFRENPPLEGSAGSDIKAAEAWDWTTGEGDVVIAVLDTGVAGGHEDLAGKMAAGYNFINDGPDAYDDHGHGTFVASIAAAQTDNGVGIAGVCWHARVMPIKCVRSSGAGSYLDIAAAIRFAADNGARVINLSLGGRSPSFILEEACRYAFEKGCVIVGSAGNQGGPVIYPAGYDEYCLAVAATDAHDQVPAWSNYGPQVDVAAPGDEVRGAWYSPFAPQYLDRYGYKSGTSFSAPFVAGAAALLWAYKPFLTNAEVMELIKITADDVNASVLPGVDERMGYGRINLHTLLAPYKLD